MIFPDLKVEPILQENDKTRLDGIRSFVSTGESPITLIEIQPEATESFIDVTSDSFLDWAYSTDGTKVVIIRITTDGSPVTMSKNIEVLTSIIDKLFSNDSDLVTLEPDILGFLKEGRNSYLDIHRLAQDEILKFLDAQRITNTDGNKLKKENIFDIEEVKNWSKYLALQKIFSGLSNAIDDIFMDKSKSYELLTQQSRNRAQLRLDLDEDGIEDFKKDLRSFNIIRRG